MNETLTQPDFTREIRDRLEAPTCAYDLLLAASSLVTMRAYSGVLDYGIPHLRSQMKAMWPEHKNQCVVAVDPDNIMHMAWAVQPNNAEHVLKMLRNIYKATSPDVCIFCCDNNPSKKTTVMDYKADRTPKPTEFYDMYAAVKQSLAAKGMQIESHEGFEADDVMASIAFRCQLLEMECVLVGTDKDLFQCLGKNTAIYNPIAKDWRNADWVRHKYRVQPAQFVDWLCLVGGKNNIEGCVGIGEKTASDLLEAWGEFCTIYDHRGSLKKNQRAGIEAFYPKYWDVREAHYLARHVCVGWGPKCSSAA